MAWEGSESSSEKIGPPFSSTGKFIKLFGPPNYRRTTSTAERSIQKRTMKRTTNSQGKTNTLKNKTVMFKTDDEDNQIKQWLSPLDPGYKHQSVQTNRMDGVGGWLLETNEFREWSGSQGVPKQSVLFCYGHPGVGKTHIR